MDLRQQAIKGLVWSAIQSWGRQAIAFIVFSLIARLVEPEAFGLVALAGVFLAFIQVFLDQGFADAIVQRQKLDSEHLDTAFWTNLGIGLLLTVLGITAAGLVADFFNQPQLTPIIRWLSLSFLLTALCSVPEAIFRRNLAFKPLAVRSLVAVITGGFVGAIMALMGYGVWSLVGQQLVNSSVQVLVIWWASDWQPGFNVSTSHFKDLFAFGINVIGIKLLDFLNRRSDDFLIGYFLGPVALGYYTVAYKILLIVTDLLTSVTCQVAMPTFAKIQQETEKLRHAFYKVTQLTSFVSFPVFIGIAALAPELVTVLFGNQWLPSVSVMQVLAFIGIVHSVTYFNGAVILACGKPFWKLKLNCMHAVANVVLFAIAVRWGIVAVAAAYVIRSYLLSPVDLYVIRRLISIKLTTYFCQYIAPLVATITMFAVIVSVNYFLNGLVSLHILLSVCTLLGTIAYLATSRLIAPTLVWQVLDLFNSVLLLGLQRIKG